MKKMPCPLIKSSMTTAFCVVCACFLTSGCASTPKAINEDSTGAAVEQPAERVKVEKIEFSDYERRLINAERKEKRLMGRLSHAESTDEIIRCKRELDDVHAEIELLKKHKDAAAAPENEGFKSVKERRYTYGPLGMLFKFTQRVLEWLYIMDRS